MDTCTPDAPTEFQLSGLAGQDNDTLPHIV